MAYVVIAPIKIAIVSFVFVLLSVILKQNRPEFVFLLRVFVVIILVSFIIDYVSELISNILSIVTIFNIDSLHISLLFKVVGITLVTDIITDTLIDNGESSIANVITFISKLLVLFLTMPLINGLIIISLRFIE